MTTVSQREPQVGQTEYLNRTMQMQMPLDMPAETAVQMPVDMPADVPVDMPADVPVDMPADVPADVPVEMPADILADIPVEMIDDNGQDGAWLNLSGQWVKIVSVENLWDIDGYDAGAKPFIRMHFRVMDESGRQIWLFQDLIDGSWYQEVAPGGGKRPQTTPACRV